MGSELVTSRSRILLSKELLEIRLLGIEYSSLKLTFKTCKREKRDRFCRNERNPLHKMKCRIFQRRSLYHDSDSEMWMKDSREMLSNPSIVLKIIGDTNSQ